MAISLVLLRSEEIEGPVLRRIVILRVLVARLFLVSRALTVKWNTLSLVKKGARPAMVALVPE